MTKYIVGISAYYHESSVCLVSKDKILDFIKEEEVTRIKGDHKFPLQAIKKIIKKYKIKNYEIEAVVFYEKPFLSWSAITYNALSKPIKKWKVVLNQFQKFWTGSLSFSSDLNKVIKISSKKIYYCPHHLSHSLNGLYFAKKYSNEYLIFIIDGVGDGETLSIYKKINNKILTEKKCKYPNSLGLFYSTFTQYLGFNINNGESKVMGLASFGKPEFKDLILNEIINFNNNDIVINETWFAFTHNPEISYSEKFINIFGKPGTAKHYKDIDSTEFKRLANIASSVQSVLEHLLKKIVTKYMRKTGIKNIIFSGGVGLNSKAMQVISSIEGINEFTVPASPGDSGSSLGAAIYGHMLLYGFKFPKFNLLPGKIYTDSVNSNIFPELFQKLNSFDNVESKIAEMIDEGDIIATFINNREFGPRSLGSRSLICAGNKSKTIENLNRNLKKREIFRPLAPMIRDKNLKKYFFYDDSSVHNFFWMGLTANTKPITKEKYSKAVHVDNTSRIQIIDDRNKFFYSLFLELEKRDIDILINTSFNVAGDPIVFDYVDCYTNMKRMNLKYLLTDDGLYKINQKL